MITYSVNEWKALAAVAEGKVRLQTNQHAAEITVKGVQITLIGGSDAVFPAFAAVREQKKLAPEEVLTLI